MKHSNLLVGVTLAVGVVLGLLGSQMLSGQDNLKAGKVLQRTELKAAPGWEAILVERILPPGAESGKHTQSGNEIVYIQDGSVIFEAQGKPAVTLKPGEAFTTARPPLRRPTARSRLPLPPARPCPPARSCRSRPRCRR